jgi:fatty-acyl-CoA synthase
MMRTAGARLLSRPMIQPENKLKELRARLADVPQRIATAAKVAQTSGLMWNLTMPGARALVTTLRTGARNPSQVYRIHALNTPDKPALKWRDESITFAELDRRIDAIASALARRGFGRGTSVLLMMRNRPEFIEAANGVSRMGGAAVAVSWRSTANELVYLASHCGARAIIVEADLWPAVEEAKKQLPNVDVFFSVGGQVPGAAPFEDLLAGTGTFDEPEGAADDASVVIYTSGTTGKPKGAVRKFPKEALPAVMRILAETPMRVDDIHLAVCPLYHATAFAFLTFTHLLGATAVILDDFKPELFLQTVERHGVTQTALVPTMLHRILALGEETLERYDTRSLRAIFSLGAPLPGPLAIETMDHFGDVLYNLYGATEIGLVTIAKPFDLRAAPATIGQLIPGNEVRLLDDAGNEVRPGTVGELYVRNQMLVAGYHKDAEATRSSMNEGFFSVGDLARCDRDGRYFIEGRKRDMVISGGVNVYPAEVEGVLEQHPGLSEVAVIGVEDAEWGERVRAFVVRRPGHTVDEGELKTWTRERLAGPKVPRDFVFLDVLPRNPTGKVLKRELRERK